MNCVKGINVLLNSMAKRAPIAAMFIWASTHLCFAGDFTGKLKWEKYVNKDCGYSIMVPKGVTLIAGVKADTMGLDNLLGNLPECKAYGTQIVRDCGLTMLIYKWDGKPVVKGSNVVWHKIYIAVLEKYPPVLNFEGREWMRKGKDEVINGKRFSFIEYGDSAMGRTLSSESYIFRADNGTAYSVTVESFWSFRERKARDKDAEMDAACLKMLKSFRLL